MKDMTIATYNIRHGHDVGFDWKKIAEIVHRSGADIIGFQEIDMHTNRVSGRDTIKGLSEAMGFPYAVFIPAMDFDGGRYGTAILSRFPITACEIHPLCAGKYEPRAFGCVRVSFGEGKELCFLNTHLSYESAEQQSIQFAELAAFMDKQISQEMPAVLTGDFNTEDFSMFHPLRTLGYDLVNDGAHTYKTFRTEPLAIDNIVYRSAYMTPMDHGMIDSDTSDHNLLWCRFRLS